MREHLVLMALAGHFIALIACTCGLFYSQYRENWLQHVGMIAVGLASAARIGKIYDRGYASPEAALLALGIAAFALGVAWKVWQNHRYDPPRLKRQR